MKVLANIFGWIGLFIIMGGAIAALLPLIPIALIGLLCFLPAAFYGEKTEEGENNNE